MIESLNTYRETVNEEESLKIIYYRDRREISSRTRNAFEEALNFVRESEN